MDALTLPVVNLDGTSGQALFDGYLAAHDAIRVAMDAVAETGPHGRDYHLIGPAATCAALAEHRARMVKLREVLVEIETLAKAVMP